MYKDKEEIELEDIAKYISYRVELALYQIFSEDNPDMTWEEFLALVSESELIREAAQCIAYDSIELFDPKQFVFDMPERIE